MKYYKSQVSYFVQGVLILEQFIWGFPKLLSCFLGIVNELQTISYLYKYSDENSNILTFEIDVISKIARPFNLIPYYFSYFNFCFLIVFVGICLIFLKIIKDIQDDIFNGLQFAYNNNRLIKYMVIFFNITINLILYGLGVFVVEFNLFTIIFNQDNYLIIVLSSISIVMYSYLVYLFQEMFSYNWALDFSKEHMLINESPLIQFRIMCKFFQIIISVIFKQGQSYQLLQITIIIITSCVQILLLQKFKVYLYGKYYFIILALNCFYIILATQYFFITIFQTKNPQYLWIVLVALPFQYLKYTSERQCQHDFLDIKKSSIEVCNFILFTIIQSQQQNKIVHFYQQLLYLIYLENHKKNCLNSVCICKETIKKNLKQTVHNLFFSDLQTLYENQINDMSFQCSQDQIIFAYLQLLFFQKKHLVVFQLIQVVFTKLQNYQCYSEKRNNQYSINKNVFRIKSQHRVIILQVAQCLVKADIKYLLSSQKQKSNSEQMHQKISELVQYQHISILIKRKLLHIIQLKINFLEKIYSDASKANEYAFKTIRAINDGMIFFQSLLRKIQDKKLSRIILFYQVEILSDYIGAQSQEPDMTVKHNELLLYFQRDFSSLIVNISDCEHVEILNYTFNNNDSLGKLQFNTFENLIPEFVQKHHSKLIEGFISGKQNKFYLATNDSFVPINSILVDRIDLVMDVTSISMSKLEMTLLISKKYSNAFSILLDDKMCIQNIEEQLFCEIFNIQIQFASQFAGLHISNLLPQLQQDFTNFSSNFLYFIDFYRVYENQTTSTRFSSNKIDSKDFLKYWQNKNYLIQYSCEIQIFERQPQNIFKYYDVLVINPKRLSKEHEIVIQQPPLMKNQTIFNESISIDLPQGNDFVEVLDAVLSPHVILKSDRDMAVQDKLISPMSPNKSKESIRNSSLQIEKIQKEEKMKEESSQKTSVSAIQNSQFFQQFSFVNKILTALKPPGNLFKIQIALILSVITLIIGVSFILDEVDQFHYFAYDFQLLGIKKDVLYPILAFQLVRYTILNYKSELALSIINQQTYDDLVYYSYQHLYTSYDELKVNIIKIINQESFANLYSVDYLNLLFLEFDDEGEEKKLDLRTTLMTLLNYQYEIQQAYIRNGKADYKSPYFYYSNKNYGDILRTISEANLLVLNQSINRSKNSYKTIFSIILTISVSLLILQFLITLYSYQLQSLILNFICLILNSNKECVNLEIQRTKQLVDLIETQFEKVENYVINISEKDIAFKALEKQARNKKHEECKKIGIQYKQIILKNLNFLIILLVLSILTVQIYNYSGELQNTAQFYKTLSDINIDILILFSSREVLYHKYIYPFLNQTDFDYYKIIAEISLTEIQQYVDILSSNINQYYIMDSQFQSIFNDFNSGDLCIQLIKIDSDNEICYLVLDGILQQGFQSSLVYLKNSISVEIESTNFTTRISYPIRELEGVVMLSQGMKSLIEQYYDFLCTHNSNMEAMFNIIIVSCLVFSLFCGGYMLIYLRKIETCQYNSATKFIYLTPLTTILYDENFMRNTKSLLITNDLM